MQADDKSVGEGQRGDYNRSWDGSFADRRIRAELLSVELVVSAPRRQTPLHVHPLKRSICCPSPAPLWASRWAMSNEASGGEEAVVPPAPLTGGEMKLTTKRPAPVELRPAQPRSLLSRLSTGLPSI